MYDYRFGTAIVFSILAVVAGAIMYWAITAPAHGFRISTVGVVLMVAGAAGLVISTALYATSRVNGRHRSSFEHQAIDSQGHKTFVREEVASG